jgi:hypothetical protein
MFWSRYAWGRRLSTDLTGSWVGHRACLDAVAKKKQTHSCRETSLSSNVRQLAGSDIKESYKVQNKLKYQSFVIGHSTPSCR